MTMKQQLLFEMEDLSEEFFKKNIEQAKCYCRSALRSHFDYDVNIGFSFGKDSLLCALLVNEVLEELHDNRKVYLNFYNSGYEKDLFQQWAQYVKSKLPKRFVFRVIKPAPLFRLSVLMLGRGRTPVNAAYGRWCTNLKVDFIKTLERFSGKKRIRIVGIRGDESKKRKDDIEHNGVFDGETHRVIGKVTTNALWWYLKNNSHKINIEFEKLKKFYAGEKRDGCWYCYAQKYDKEVDIKSAIMIKLRQYVGNKQLLPMECRVSPDIIKTNLDTCKTWYFGLRQIEAKYKTRLLNNTDRKLIFELWNYREAMHEPVTKKLFLDDYLNGRYKPLFPELFDVAFHKKGNNYYYNWYEIYIDDKKVSLN